MARISIDRDTFQDSGEPPRVYETKYGNIVFYPGTVTVRMGDQSVTAKAERNDTGTIWVKGFVGRYRTSSNPWKASVTLNADGRISAHFGRDDRSGRFNKMDAISYEPDTYDSI